jgi:hypothetical protein
MLKRGGNKMPKKEDKKPNKKTENKTTQKQQEEQNQETQILDRGRLNFSKRFQAILYSEPKHIALIGFYLVFFTALVIGLWSFFSVVNKSYIIGGEIINLNPDVSVSISKPFEFKKYFVHIGQKIEKGEKLFEYYDKNKKVIKYNAPSGGTIAYKAELKQSVLYPAKIELISIRPDNKEIAVRLYIPQNILNKIKINAPVVFRFNFPLNKNELITGTILTEPIQLDNEYIAEAKIDQVSLQLLMENNVRLINGLFVNAEIIVGQERLLERFLGVKL